MSLQTPISGQLLFSAVPATHYHDKPKSTTDHHNRLTALSNRTAPKPIDNDKKVVARRKTFKVLWALLWSRDRPALGALQAKGSARALVRAGWFVFPRQTMSTNESSGQESGESADKRRGIEAVAKRVHRALDSFYHVEAAGDGGEYTVFSGSGNTYTVDLPEGTCTCPDGQRGAWCKHAHRAAFVTGEIPAIDGIHVAATDTDDSEADGKDNDEQAIDDPETLAERVERFEANNPGASAIEVIGQLGIDPSQKERVEEVLA